MPSVFFFAERDVFIYFSGSVVDAGPTGKGKSSLFFFSQF